MRLRLRVYVKRGGLDRKIAGDGLCDSTRERALRSRQLTSRRARDELARRLRRTVDYVERPGSRALVTAVVLDRTAVAVAREPILGLAERLEGPTPVNPRGMALAGLLLSDGRSPLFNPSCKRTVTQAIWEIQDSLGSFYVEDESAPAPEPREA